MLRVLALFPSINFGLLRSEIFPWAAIYSIFIMRSLNYRFLGIVLLLFFSSLIFALKTDFVYFSEHVRSFAAYLNPLLVFFALLSASDKEIVRVKKVFLCVFIGLLVLGLMQLVGILSPLGTLVSYLVPRGSAESLSTLGRGVTLLSSEPSRAGYELLFIYAAVRTLYNVNGNRYIYDLLFFLYILVVIQSAVSALLTLFYLLLLYKGRYLSLLLLLPFLMVAISYIDSRATIFLSTVMDSSSIVSLFDYLLDSSGFRLISIISAYWYGIMNIFGGGVGLWQLSSIEALDATGISASEVNYFLYFNNGEFGGVRPTSYAANLMLDTGSFGLIFFITIMKKYLFILRTSALDSVTAAGNLFLFSFFIIGSVGNPIPWISIALVIRQESLLSTVIGENVVDKTRRQESRILS